MGTAAKSAHISHPIEEFVDYDSQGHSVILRRNVEHPGQPLAGTPSKKAPGFSVANVVSTLTNKGIGGGFGFFSDFKEVRQQLRQKGLISGS